MTKKIAVQLYSVREHADKDYEGTVRKIADMGYAGVEPAGYPGTDVQAASKLFQELGLLIPSVHTALPFDDDKNRVLDEAKTLGTKRVISGRGPDNFKTVDEIKKVADVFNEASAAAQEAGLAVGMHNHWWEFQPVEGDGRLGYEVLLDHLSPEVFFQIDTYWVMVAGQDPVEIVKKLGSRVPELHIKDGPGVQEEPMLAAGTGKMNFPPIVEAATSADWLIVELDRCATDMMEAVKKSFDYLVGANLGSGK